MRIMMRMRRSFGRTLTALAFTAGLALAGQAVQAEQYNVVYIAPTLSNAADLVIARNWQEQAEAEGMNAVIKNADHDPVLEANEWDNAIALGVDAIVGAPVDSVAAVASVKKANEAGIPVFMLGRASSAGGRVELIAWADNAALGTVAAEELVRRLGVQHGEVKGIILELQGEQALLNARVRSDAINAVLSQYPGLKVISRDTHYKEETVFDITKSIVSINDVVGITMGTDVIPGADAGLRATGKWKKIGDPDHIVITGIDADPRILDLMGEGYWDASALQDMVTYGTITAHYMKDFLDGTFKIDKAGPISNPGRAYDGHVAIWAGDTEGWKIETPSRVIDISNHKDPNLWGNAVKKYQ